MNLEIERKFIVNPHNEVYLDLVQEKNFTLENRYYLFRNGGIELRFTSLEKSTDSTEYTLDRMEVKDDTLTVRKKERLQISKNEFGSLLRLLQSVKPEVEPIIRKSYNVSENPKVQIKVYGGKFEGLIRAEIEFESKEECDNYKPLDWMGAEISNTPIGNDVTLAGSSLDEFKSHIENFSNQSNG